MAEHNLIQNPELLSRVAKLLGMRQAHVVPTLNEGVQAVVIVDDARNVGTGPSSPPGAVRRSFVASAWSTVAANLENFHQFYNSVTGLGSLPAGTVYRVKRMTIRTSATTPWRLRMGWRNAQIGGALAETAYPNTEEQGKTTGTGVQLYVGNIATNGSVITSVWGEWYISASQPVEIGPELGLVIVPGSGVAWQSFGIADSSNTMSSVLCLDEMVP